MKLAISNIAWDIANDSQILPRLRALGVTGIEVAPTKFWPDWQGVSPVGARDIARRVSDIGLQIPALQAVLYGRDDLALFKPETHEAFLDHLQRVADLAVWLGARVIVFGAPRNRQRGSLPMEKAREIAAGFFRRAGHLCRDRNIRMGLEANPLVYGCDFITTTKEARDFVTEVNDTGFQLHLDSGAVIMNSDDIDAAVAMAGPFIHFHASEPMLAPLAGGVVDHRHFARSLKVIGYREWVSIEMKAPESEIVLFASVQKAVDAYQEVWG